jgi:glucokinase
VIVTPNLGWRDFPLRDEVSRRVNLPATLDNDANCATLGEWWCGAAKGGRNVVGLTIGTGIGGGLILDGKLYHGASDAAGEIGHTTIDSTGRRCKCGNYGCLEAYTSGPAIAERARETLEGGDDSILTKIVDGDHSRITAQTVFEASKQGDAVALEVVRDTAHFLGVGISNLINIFNPDTFVIAGGVTQAGDLLFDPLRAEVRRRAFKPSVDACRIVPGALPLSAGVVGAVATFRAQTLGDLRHFERFSFLERLYSSDTKSTKGTRRSRRTTQFSPRVKLSSGMVLFVCCQPRQAKPRATQVESLATPRRSS